jgi:hypothetical protein
MVRGLYGTRGAQRDRLPPRSFWAGFAGYFTEYPAQNTARAQSIDTATKT